MVGFVNDHTLFIQCKANIRAWFWMRKWIISCRLWYPAKASRVIGRSFFGSLFGPGTLITTFRHLSLGTLPLFCIAWTAASSFGMSPFSMAYHNGEVNSYTWLMGTRLSAQWQAGTAGCGLETHTALGYRTLNAHYLLLSWLAKARTFLQ